MHKFLHKFFLALILAVRPGFDRRPGSIAARSRSSKQACTPRRAAFLPQADGIKGDFTILALPSKENRPKLSPACRDVLVSHGQMTRLPLPRKRGEVKKPLIVRPAPTSSSAPMSLER